MKMSWKEKDKGRCQKCGIESDGKNFEGKDIIWNRKKYRTNGNWCLKCRENEDNL